MHHASLKQYRFRHPPDRYYPRLLAAAAVAVLALCLAGWFTQPTVEPPEYLIESAPEPQIMCEDIIVRAYRDLDSGEWIDWEDRDESVTPPTVAGCCDPSTVPGAGEGWKPLYALWSEPGETEEYRSR